MSVLSSLVSSKVQEIIDAGWAIRDGRVVPKTDDITLRNGAVRVEATYLFADLGDSSTAAQKLKKEVTGKIIRSYLDAASRIIRNFGGEIRSFDGDRVMGIFMGGSKSNDAVKAALGINWALHKVLQPKLATKWPDLSNYYRLHHGIGIATGEALIVRGGVRDNNDLVSVGPAANIAAKLSDLRGAPSTYITADVFGVLNDDVKTSEDGRSMWSEYAPQTIGGKTFRVIGSTWWRRP